MTVPQVRKTESKELTDDYSYLKPTLTTTTNNTYITGSHRQIKEGGVFTRDTRSQASLQHCPVEAEVASNNHQHTTQLQTPTPTTDVQKHKQCT
jgi:hypothetical protein